MKIRTKSSIRRHIPVIHGGKIPVKNSDHNIIDFSSNITPLGIPNSVKSIIKKNLDNVKFYPDPHSDTVISSLEKYTHLSKSNKEPFLISSFVDTFIKNIDSLN